MTSDSNDDYAQVNLGAGNKWVKSLTQNRLGQFVGGHFSNNNLSAALFTHRKDDDKHVKLLVWSAPGLEKPTFQEAMKQKFKPAKKGDSFGPSCRLTVPQTNHWWKVTLNIPQYWTKYERVQFEFDPGCEAMIFANDGTPLQGITGGHGGDRRVDFIIPETAIKAGTYSFVIESSCNGMFGIPWNGDIIEPPDMNRYFSLDSADLVVPNQEAWRLLWDFETLKQISESVPGNSSLQNKALTAANAIINTFDVSNAEETIKKSRKIAEDVFGKDWEAKGEEIYSEGATDHVRIWGIGHCHIDSAWLWPYSVTKQKVARSWSSQIDLMRRYPEHRFTCSHAQQFKWCEELYPKLFDIVKEYVRKGQFQPVGGSWVEHDGTMPSGEAFARQLLYGQKYFESRFGKRCDSAWLPDSFGYSAALPQLFRSAGMEYFFTQKMSWNNINVFPHSTFNWVGLDGTQVLCHMTPVDTYTAQATVGDVVKGANNHKNLESSDVSLLVFGNGDGGGGPLSKMMENLRRIRAAGNQSRDLPVVSMGDSVEDFFAEIMEKTKGGKTLPVWHGEFYLELHRGIFTSHGSIKKGNRKSEILLRDVEHLSTFASLFKSKDGYKYPKSRIDTAWEKLMLNQFHDVLPGSCIGMVYDDADEYYAQIAKTGKVLLEEAWEALFPRSYPLSLEQPLKSAEKGRIIGYSSLPFPRREVVAVPLSGGAGASRLRSETVQISSGNTEGYLLMECPSGGLAKPRGLFADIKAPSATTNDQGRFTLRNESVLMSIENGRIVSLMDLDLNRELIPKGQTGGLIWFNDKPNYWDAWDVEIHHLETPHELKFTDIRIVENGPVRASVQADASYGKSKVKVTISVDAVPATTKFGSRAYIRFDAVVDWHQKHEILKFQIPLNIHSDNATYECPFGYVCRPTHKNTTIDIAQFEVCGHKYADLSEYGYGVAFLSESKYGYACQGNILSMSLLRAATAPDADQDQGLHKFSWGVLPHIGHFLESDVPVAAYIFNSPLHMRYVTSTPDTDGTPLLSDPLIEVVGAPSVILETIKRGEDDEFSTSKGKTSIILRLYEAMGGHAQATVRISHRVPVAEAFVTNILEDDVEKMAVEAMKGGDHAIKVQFRGFQVHTVKLVLSSSKGKDSDHDSWVSVDVRKFLTGQA